MSNVGLSMQESASGGPRGPRTPRKPKRSGGAPAIIAGAVVVVLILAVAFGGFLVVRKLKSGAAADDYAGPGQGEVVVEVVEGQTLADIGKTLKANDVVASVQAFTDASMLEERATSIAPGKYVMMQQMSGEDAVQLLLDPSSRNANSITIPEGLRSYQVVDLLSKSTGIKKSEFNAVLTSPGQLPLPDWAEGSGDARAEGFLFPATYEFDKDASAADILNAMVAKFEEVATSMDFENRSAELGYSPYEVLTVASLIEAEAPSDEFDKVSRVIYNRIKPETWGETYGYLGFDSTINYALKQSDLNPSGSQRDLASPYNTYTEHHQGLPPTPIENPGQKAMEAALTPTKGKWLYFVTTDPDTGETKFTDSYSQHLANQREFQNWLANNPQN